MPFTRDVLNDDEELLAELRPHPLLVVPPFLLVAIAIGAAIVIAVRFPGAPVVVAWPLGAMVVVPSLWAIVRLLRWRAARLLVTSSRIVYRRGVLGRDVVQLRLQRVAEVHCRQSVFQRLMGAGTLAFEVAGADAPLVVDDVRRPRRVQGIVTAQLDQFDQRGPVGQPGPGQRRSRAWTDTPPHGVSRPDPAQRTTGTITDRLVQLDELRRRGIVSEAEFAAKKAELLQRL